MTDVLSEIRSLPTLKTPKDKPTFTHKTDYWVNRQDVEKLVKADQEKHAALMTHLQNFPSCDWTPDVYDYADRCAKWGEKLKELGVKKC